MTASFEFNQDRAFSDLRALSGIGPRPGGSRGMLRQRSVLYRHFAERADRVSFQPFVAEVESLGTTVAMANIVASWNPERPLRKLVGAHYDTRPIEGFVGANDGASGTALLMELARSRRLREVETIGIDLVLFDGEECIYDPAIDAELLGSSHFARRYEESGGGLEYVGALVVDMVAGAQAVFRREASSYLRAFDLQEEVWSLAERLGMSRFLWEIGPDVVDDHVPLLDAGIPAVVLVDTSYPEWHTPADTWESGSPMTLGDVGRLVEAWLLLE